jgi:hypothetical protein
VSGRVRIVRVGIAAVTASAALSYAAAPALAAAPPTISVGTLEFTILRTPPR